MKERVTLTLDKDLLEQVDQSVNGHTIKNRSHAVELLLIKAMGRKQLLKAVVLAGGGKTIKVDGVEIPRSMRVIKGKPILQNNLELLKRYGVTETIISIGPKGGPIKEYFGSGKKFGLNISYVEEDEPLGTAGPLILKKNELTEPFVVCNADELKNIDLIDMFAFHKDRKATATVALIAVKDPKKYGRVRMKGASVVEFVEKPKDDSGATLISLGLYILSPQAFDFMPESGRCMLEKDVFPKIAQKGALAGYPTEGQWYDTTDERGFELAQKDWRGI